MVELRVNLHFFQTRYNEGILDWIIYDQRKIHFVIGEGFETLATHIHGDRFVLAVTTVDHDPVFQPGFLAQFPFQGLRQ